MPIGLMPIVVMPSVCVFPPSFARSLPHSLSHTHDTHFLCCCPHVYDYLLPPQQQAHLPTTLAPIVFVPIAMMPIAMMPVVYFLLRSLLTLPLTTTPIIHIIPAVCDYIIFPPEQQQAYILLPLIAMMPVVLLPIVLMLL